jgi:hypothetical protein
MPQPTPPSSTHCRQFHCISPSLTPSWLARFLSSPVNVSSNSQVAVGSTALPLRWRNLSSRRTSILRNKTSRQVRELLTQTTTQFPRTTYRLFPSSFGCPVFALNNSLALNKALPRLDPRARIGLNLGPSPTHARNVHLVLSLTTGLVSPQFHVRLDDFFETCKYGVTDGGLASTWQCLAGFKRGSSN